MKELWASVLVNHFPLPFIILFWYNPLGCFLLGFVQGKKLHRRSEDGKVLGREGGFQSEGTASTEALRWDSTWLI